MKDKERVNRGKKAKAAGARFELKVRKNLESKGWVVSKWMNNLSWFVKDAKGKTTDYKMHPAKHRFRGPGIPMAIGTGFPDFIAYKFVQKVINRFYFIKFAEVDTYAIMGIEVKSNGYLKPEEKEKCAWLLKNNIFSKILIASKGEKRGSIDYKEFK